MATEQMQIDPDDIRQLFQALDAWEHEPMKEALYESLMTTITSSMASEKHTAAEYEARIAADRRQAEAAVLQRREQTILIRAKLLLWRDRMVAEAAAEHLRQERPR